MKRELIRVRAHSAPIELWLELEGEGEEDKAQEAQLRVQS